MTYIFWTLDTDRWVWKLEFCTADLSTVSMYISDNNLTIHRYRVDSSSPEKYTACIMGRNSLEYRQKNLTGKG